MTYYKHSPRHFAFASPGRGRNDSPCGLAGLWNRGLDYTLDRSQVSCRHCLRWLHKYPERPTAVQS